MDKETALNLWRVDLNDDTEITRMVRKAGFEKVSAQAVRHWRQNKATTRRKRESKYEAAILAACAERFKGRRLVPGTVVEVADTV